MELSYIKWNNHSFIFIKNNKKRYKKKYPITMRLIVCNMNTFFFSTEFYHRILQKNVIILRSIFIKGKHLLTFLNYLKYLYLRIAICKQY